MFSYDAWDTVMRELQLEREKLWSFRDPDNVGVWSRGHYEEVAETIKSLQRIWELEKDWIDD